MQYFSFVVLAALSAVLLIPGIFQIYIGILCRKEENLDWTLGTRISTKTVRNVYEPGTWNRRKLDHYTHFIYEYSVEGKIYTLRGSLGVAPGKLPKSPRIIYLKSHPQFAKIKGVQEFYALTMGGFMTFGGLFFGVMAMFSLFV